MGAFGKTTLVASLLTVVTSSQAGPVLQEALLLTSH